MPDVPNEHRARSPKVGDAMREHAVLVVGAMDAAREPSGASGVLDAAKSIRSMLAPLVAHVDYAAGSADAIEQIDKYWYDAVIVEAGRDAESALSACEEIAKHGCSKPGGPSVVMFCERASLGLATRAMQLGVRDLLSADVSQLELCQRVRAAIEASESHRDAADREARLKRLCSKLDRARRDVSGQVGSLCTDLADAYQDLAEQIGELATAGELSAILRQELDVEGLLRTFLEYLLGRVGSTNAGIFLPNSVGDYSLGAYINYDRPRETAEQALEELACVIAPAFECDHRLVRLSTDDEIAERVGADAGFFADETVVAVACHDTPGDAASECLAVVCLFRDRRTPFSAKALRTIQVASELFGKQMARVIRVHHRHKPDEIWRDDDIDLAA